MSWKHRPITIISYVIALTAINQHNDACLGLNFLRIVAEREA